jgi:hypothetical protein
MLTRPRGRPKKADAKVPIHIRLSPQALGYFRATGARVADPDRRGAAELGIAASQLIPPTR